MPNIQLTDVSLRSLKPPVKGQLDFWDSGLPSFGCRLSQGGSKTFLLKHDNRRITIGRYPIISLHDARNEAKRLLAEFTLGRIRPQSLAYSEAVKLFLEDKAKSKRARTIADYKRLLTRHFAFKGQIMDVTHAQVAQRLTRLKDTPSEHNHARTAAVIFFNWCEKRRYITQNPVIGISPYDRPSRTRVISDAELKAIWEVCDGTFGLILKLLILTGQRRGEIAALHREWIDEDARTISFPASITKNGRAHTIPFGDKTYAILDGLGSDKLLFLARRRDAPFNGWGKSKAALDELSGVKRWTLHDIRRTFATRLAEMGIAPHIIERLLNHVTGTLSPIALVYNKAKYLEEMRAAVEKWETKLTTILNSPA